MRILVLATLCLGLLASSLGQESQASRIQIEGSKQVSQEAIRAALGLPIGKAPTDEELRIARDSVERMGFFRSVKIDKVEGGIVVKVVEWPIVDRVEVTGNKALTTAEILKILQIETGRIFNSRALLIQAKQVHDAYTRKGFFGDVVSAEFTSETSTTLKVEIMEMTVNSLTPYGNKRTKTEVIEKLLYTKPGMPYNQNRWEADLRRLLATNWFEDVRSFSRESGPGRLDLVPAVVEAKTGEWTAGLGAEPGSPVVGTFSISERNFLGTGQSISFKGAQGLQTQGPSLGLDYGNPLFDHGRLALNVSLYTRFSYRFAGSGLGNGEDPSGSEAFSERRTGATIGFAKDLDQNTSAHIGVRLEDVRSDDPQTAPDAGITRQSGALASLILGFVRNTRDTDIDPARGDWLRLGVEPGFSRITRVGGSLTGAAGIGDHAFVKTTAEYRTYWSPDPRRTADDLDKARRVFALRVRYGSVYGEAPFSEQFFVGGTDSVRGYAQDRYWGNQMFISSLEYRHPLGRDVGLIGFVDYGGAWGGYGGLNDFTQSRSLNMHLGYGFGISYRMPKVGPLRLDFGFDSGGKMRTHFQIATPF